MTINYAYSNNELRGLTPVLHNWIELVDHYSKINPEDACYWYNERASLSVLAAASWQTKEWVALEEYSTFKRSPIRDKKTGTANQRAGRCDLYLASANGDAQYAIESKQAWQPIGYRVKNPFGVLRKRMSAAWDDAGTLHRSEATHRLSATFCVPSISDKVLRTHENKNQDLGLLLTEWVKALKRQVSYDALAYTFPRRNRDLVGDWSGRFYPGVVIVIKKRHRASRA